MKFSRLPQWQRFVIPLALMLLLTFVFGKQYVAKELLKKRQQVTQLETELRTARTESEELKTAKAVSVQEASVLQQANHLLRESDRQRQDEIASLKADLAFYRRLGGANGSQTGLAIHHVELRRTASARVFELVFTLTQNIRWASSIVGEIDVSIDGILNGKAEHLNEADLLAENTSNLKFEFKYFQQLERLITLPEGFKAKHLTLQLDPEGSGSNIVQTVSWQNLFGTGSIETGSLESGSEKSDSD